MKSNLFQGSTKVYISAVLLYPSRCFGRFVKNRCMGAIGTSYGMQIVFSLLTSIQDPHIEMNNLTKIISYIFLDNGKSYGLKHRFSRERGIRLQLLRLIV